METFTLFLSSLVRINFFAVFDLLRDVCHGSVPDKFKGETGAYVPQLCRRFLAPRNVRRSRSLSIDACTSIYTSRYIARCGIFANVACNIFTFTRTTEHVDFTLSKHRRKNNCERYLFIQ